MSEIALYVASQIRQIPDSVGTTGAGTYAVNWGSDIYNGTATSGGANAAYSDTAEPGRELTLIDTAATMTLWPGRRIHITSGVLKDKVLQVVKVSGTTATLNFPSADTASVIASGVTYTMIPDYSAGAKLLVYGIEVYGRSSVQTENDFIIRLIQGGGTVLATTRISNAANVHTERTWPLVIDTGNGAPQLRFEKGPTIGTSNWAGANRFYVLWTPNK